jgi:hypothetical protein
VLAATASHLRQTGKILPHRDHHQTPSTLNVALRLQGKQKDQMSAQLVLLQMKITAFNKRDMTKKTGKLNHAVEANRIIYNLF